MDEETKYVMKIHFLGGTISEIFGLTEIEAKELLKEFLKRNKNVLLLEL